MFFFAIYKFYDEIIWWHRGTSRRESQTSAGPPATDPIGSIHNLQLDIMDDIVQARKARLKLWNTSSEKVCEVQTVDEAGTSSPKRYSNRRYSDFVASSLTPIPANRRASENPCISPSVSSTATSFLKKSGIVVTKNDLITLMSTLTSSATEINKVDDAPVTPKQSSNTLAPDSMGISRSSRSNSFDVSILHNAKQMISNASSDKNAAALSGWFEKRHIPMEKKKSLKTSSATVSFSKEVLDRFRDKEEKCKESKKPKSKLRWDNKSSLVDPHVIGNAIEGFLRKGSSSKGAVPKESRSKKSSSSSKSPSFWFGKAEEDDSTDTCDSSLCSTLKDLFVK